MLHAWKAAFLPVSGLCLLAPTPTVNSSLFFLFDNGLPCLCLLMGLPRAFRCSITEFACLASLGKQLPHLFAVSFYEESHYLLTKDKKEGQNTSRPEDQGTFFVLQLQHLITGSWLRLPSYSSSGFPVNNCILAKTMLSIRNLRHGITALSPTVLLSLIVNNEYHCTEIFRHHIRVSSSQRPVCEFMNSSLTNLYMPIVVFGMWDGLNCQMHSLSTPGRAILVQARDPAKLSMEIEKAIDDHRFNDAWKLFEQHSHMEGLPRKSIVNKLLASFAESFDVCWLEKAHGLVEQAIVESKQKLLEKEPLIYLSFSLAKCGLSIPASTIIRRLIEMELYPPVTAWSAIVGHMSQTAPGAYLAAELILEIVYLFQDGRVDPRKKSNAPLIAMKPNTTSVNIALAGCLLFGKTRKAEQLLDMMPHISIKVNATLLITVAHIYERNGRREELKKLKRHVDEAYSLSDIQFRQFYTCLLTCHLKFGDLESASNMVLKMLQKAKEARNSLAAATLLIRDKSKSSTGQFSQESLNLRYGLEKNRSTGVCMISYEEFSKDRNFLKLEAEAKELLGSLLGKLQNQVELITTDHGVLLPTEKIYVKLVKAYLESGKTKDLVAFLIKAEKAEKEDSPASNDDSVLVHVINACISLGWLDQAHDLLDEMRLAGVTTSSSVYASLLKSYCKASRAGEAASLLRDARRAGFQLDSSCYNALIESRVLQNDTHGALNLFKEAKDAKIHRASHQQFEMLVKGCSEGGEAGLMTKLLREIEDGQTLDSGVHVWNNVIHFFCRKKLMQDAERALKKMRSLGHAPNAQTFHSMVTGYAAVRGKYVEVTELWGEMKALAATTSMNFDQELLDSVLYTFVRGGFFVRAIEVVDMMEKENMFIDKYKYRTLFLKYHKTLHKGKAPKFQTEAQLRKREAALSFKKWVGLQ